MTAFVLEQDNDGYEDRVMGLYATRESAEAAAEADAALLGWVVTKSDPAGAMFYITAGRPGGMAMTRYRVTEHALPAEVAAELDAAV